MLNSFWDSDVDVSGQLLILYNVGDPRMTMFSN